MTSQIGSHNRVETHRTLEQWDLSFSNGTSMEDPYLAKTLTICCICTIYDCTGCTALQVCLIRSHRTLHVLKISTVFPAVLGVCRVLVLREAPHEAGDSWGSSAFAPLCLECQALRPLDTRAGCSALPHNSFSSKPRLLSAGKWV